MFSKACEYGIRAVVYIAARSSAESKIGIDDICSHIEAPKHFTAKIMQILSRAQIISSQKGLGGGFFLDDAQKKAPLVRIVEAIDGNKVFVGCGLGLKQCSEEKPCPIHHQFKEIRNRLNDMMHRTTIAELAERLKNGGTVLMQ